jgi:hypothetical protein
MIEQVQKRRLNEIYNNEQKEIVRQKGKLRRMMNQVLQNQVKDQQKRRDLFK